MLKEVHYIPFDEPQFVVMWEYNNKIWCDTLRYNKTYGYMEILTENGADTEPKWVYDHDNSELYDNPDSNARYFIFIDEKQPKIGNVIEITDAGYSDAFFLAGDKATVVAKDCDGDFWANFNNQNNPHMVDHGIWCIGRNHPTKNVVRFKIL